MAFCKSKDRVSKCQTRCKQICNGLNEINYGYGFIGNITSHTLDNDVYCIYHEQKKIFESNSTKDIQLFINPVISLKDQEHFDELINSNRKVVFDFTAKWCGPCKRIASCVRSMARKYSKIKVIKVDVDDHETLTINLKIRSMPTFLFYINGEDYQQLSSSDETSIYNTFSEFNSL